MSVRLCFRIEEEGTSTNPPPYGCVRMRTALCVRAEHELLAIERKAKYVNARTNLGIAYLFLYLFTTCTRYAIQGEESSANPLVGVMFALKMSDIISKMDNKNHGGWGGGVFVHSSNIHVAITTKHAALSVSLGQHHRKEEHRCAFACLWRI